MVVGSEYKNGEKNTESTTIQSSSRIYLIRENNNNESTTPSSSSSSNSKRRSSRRPATMMIYLILVAFIEVSRFWWDSVPAYLYSSPLEGTTSVSLQTQQQQVVQPQKVYLNESSKEPTIYHCMYNGNGMTEARAIFQSVLPEYTKLVDMSGVGVGGGIRIYREYNTWASIPGNIYMIYFLYH